MRAVGPPQCCPASGGLIFNPPAGGSCIKGRNSPFISLNPKEAQLGDWKREGNHNWELAHRPAHPLWSLDTHPCANTHYFMDTRIRHGENIQVRRIHANTREIKCKITRNSRVMSQGEDLHNLPSHNTPLLNFMIDSMSESLNREAILLPFRKLSTFVFCIFSRYYSRFAHFMSFYTC